MDQYAVIGNPIEHSKSPQIHAAFAQQEGVNIAYLRILSEKSEFVSKVEHFVKNGGKGLNVTVPFKETAFQHCQQVNTFARYAKAVNTLSFSEQGAWIGANTDGIGLLRDLKFNIGAVITSKRILIVGAGGATRGILLPLLQEQPAEMVLVNRTIEKAVQLVTEFSQFGAITSKTFERLDTLKFDIVINATSASLDNTLPPLPDSIIDADTLCYDLAYSDKDTAFLAWSKSVGASTAHDGLGMLIEQAAESYFIWRGFRPDTNPVFKQLRPGI